MSLTLQSNTSAPNLANVLKALEKEAQTRRAENRLADYKAYTKQREFHSAGAVHRERLFMAANQCGKSVAGSAEMAIHLTGLYPDWWAGHRFVKPIRAWAAGVTGESTRDTVQRLLVGPPERENEWGTGFIPKRLLKSPQRGRGIPNGLDSLNVQHASGGQSTLLFKSYERGREKWQGDTLDAVWYDEECPFEIYMEGLTRTNATGGIVWMTFTPLLGYTEVVHMFMKDRTSDAVAARS